jgi:putative ABC transport system ATP-binding protein
MGHTSTLLQVQAITKVFEANTPHEVKALDCLSLDVAEKDFVAIVGSNGAGKTTLLNAISGVISIDSGAVCLAGRAIHNLPEHVRAMEITRVFQNPMYGIAPSLTVRENILLQFQKSKPSWMRSAYHPDGAASAFCALKQLGLELESRLDVPVKYLSHGQMQALSVFLASLSKPRLILLDEHCSSLDPRTAEVVMELTARMIEGSALTALMVTHSIPLALDFGNRLILLHQGQIIVELDAESKRATTEEDLLGLFRQKVPFQSLRDKAVLSS